MKKAIVVLGAILAGLLIFVAIFGITNVAVHTWDEIGDYGYNISRTDNPWSYTNYRVRYAGPCAGLQEVERGNVFFDYESVGYKYYKDKEGDGKVDTIFICRFGRDLYLTAEDRDNPAFAKEFLKADLVLLQTKLRFYDKAKEMMEPLQGK